MFKRIATAASAVLVLAAASAWSAPLTALGVEDRLIVGFHQGVTAVDARAMIASRGLAIVSEEPRAGLYLVQTPSGVSAQEINLLKSDPRVTDAQRDFWTKWIEEAPTSFQGLPLVDPAPLLEKASALKQNAAADRAILDAEIQWGVRRVNAPASWGTNQGAGVKVCVVDTGIDDTVADLQGQVVGGKNFVDENAPWKDDHFHGTHVAGIVAAKLDGRGVVGVAPQAKLLAAKVLTKDGQGGVFPIIQGIMWCAENKADVINMSLGAPQSIPFLEQVIGMALQQGVTVIAAAGNGDGKGGPSPVNYPGAYKGVLAVSALDDQDGITKWSSRGPEVAFIAPGLKIPSTVPTSNDASNVHAYSGTSMASPHVAGLAALAVAKGAKGPQAVAAALRRAAEKLPNLTPSEQGVGLINAAHFSR